MRTLLTYVLAAFAATFAVTILRLVFGGLSWSDFSYSGFLLDSVAIRETMFLLILILGVGTTAWLLGGFLLSRLGFQFTNGSLLVKSLLIWVSVGILAFIHDTGPVLVSYFREVVPIARLDFSYLIETLLTSTGVATFSGAVWGLVFWLRTPKSENSPEITGQAA